MSAAGAPCSVQQPRTDAPPQVGKVSSNHDRACELYAQIAGAKTDYGYWHALYNNHSRFGPDYTGIGFVPTWGESDKIHLIGHSMGPMTNMFLLNYLRNGLASETAAPYPAGEPPVSEFFTGGHNWVASLHGISGVYNGSPLATAVGPTILQLATDFLTLATQVAPSIPGESGLYDFM